MISSDGNESDLIEQNSIEHNPKNRPQKIETNAAEPDRTEPNGMDLNRTMSRIILDLMIFGRCIAGLRLEAQSIMGRMNEMPGRSIRLEGFAGFKTYPISETQSDSLGRFRLTYGSADHGVGIRWTMMKSP